MVNLEKICENYLSRVFVVTSSTSLAETLKEFYGVTDDSILFCDNFSAPSLPQCDKDIKAICYKPKFGFLGKIESAKKNSESNGLIFIEDFTESFSANLQIGEKYHYAGTFGNVSVCSFDGFHLYATDDENLADKLREASTPLDEVQKQRLHDFVFEAEAKKHERRVASANYTALFAYLGLLNFVTPLAEIEGEVASFQMFPIRAKDSSGLLQHLCQAGVPVTQGGDFLLLPTDTTIDEQNNIANLILKFYKE